MRAIVIVLLVSTSVFAQGNTAVVEKAKADLEAQGVDLSGPCGAFRIANRVAWYLRPAYGFLIKQGGNRAVIDANGTCVSGDVSSAPGYATDYLIDRATGFGWDVLGDGGGANRPQFAGPETDPGMVARNRAQFAEPFEWTVVDAGHTQPPVTPPAAVGERGPIGLTGPKGDQGDPGPAVDLSPIVARLAALEQLATELTTRVRVLEAKPIPTSCTASINLVFARPPVSCKLQ